MFTPMNGRRSLLLGKRSLTCDENDDQEEALAKIALEGIRFYVKFNNNPEMDTAKYLEMIGKNNSNVFKIIMKHIINGTKNMSRSSNN